jgi:LacI family transcriptional regulator, galactose operon repressor
LTKIFFSGKMKPVTVTGFILLLVKTKNSSTIRDVARMAGVSVATVSRYLNNATLLAADTALRVQQTMDELNFVPHPIARNLATNRTNTIGLLLLDIGGNFYSPLLRGIEAVSSESGYDLLIHSTRSSHGSNARKRTLTEHNTDGLLSFTDALDNLELTRLNRLGFPLVLMHQSPPSDIDIPMVTIENQEGARQIVEHLIKVHHRKRIVFLQGPSGNEDSHARELGYCQALLENELPYNPTLVAIGNFDPEYAYLTLKKLINDGIEFDAIFTGDDDSAIGVLQALQEAGIRVPESVSVVGFDDSIFARLLNPSLTTIHAPIEEVGREAVNQLINLIRGEFTEPRIVLPTDLIIRQSCGCRR